MACLMAGLLAAKSHYWGLAHPVGITEFLCKVLGHQRD